MKNIQILVRLKEQLLTADFMIEDLDSRLSAEKIELSELIMKGDEDIDDLSDQLSDISLTLLMFTEDLRSSLSNEGFDCEAYSTWVNELEYDMMRLTGLLETFEEAHKILELYINETIRGYRILTQDGYGMQE